MTRLDEIIANALAGIPETDAAILAREVVRLRGATSVVVPEPTMFDVNREYFERFATVFTSQHAREAHKTGFLAGVDWFREHSRAIPADRVLGEGEIKGTPEELAKIAESAGWKWVNSPIESKGPKTLVEWMTDALRANQGEADHD